MEESLNIITIDGLSGTGKTAMMYKLAQRLKYKRFGIGYIFRAIIYCYLYENNVDYRLINVIPNNDYNSVDPCRILYNNIEITEKLHGNPEIDKMCAKMSADKHILQKASQVIFQTIIDDNWVVEGRNAASFFPNADFKFVLICDKKQRQQRVFNEMKKNKIDSKKIVAVMKESENRNYADMYLSIDPMMVHNDTVIIDSTYMLPEETSNTLYEYCMNKMTINVSFYNGASKQKIKECCFSLNLNSNATYFQFYEHLFFHSRKNNVLVIDISHYFDLNNKECFSTNFMNWKKYIQRNNKFIVSKRIDSAEKHQNLYSEVLSLTCYYSVVEELKKQNKNWLSIILNKIKISYPKYSFKTIDLCDNYCDLEEHITKIQEMNLKTGENTIFILIVPECSMVHWNAIINTLLHNIKILCIYKCFKTSIQNKILGDENYQK